MKSVSALGLSAALLAAAGALTATPALADASYDRYRCSVNGDTAFCRTPEEKPAVRVEHRVVLGPYATYLDQRGESREDAIEMALRVGEAPVEQIVRVTKPNLTSYERYRQWLGDTSIASVTYDVLAEQPITATAAAR